MTVQRSTVIVVDVESTCWENNRVPQGQRSEIIEIGVCTLDPKTGERADKRSLMVKPVASEVSAFCTQLTHITPEMVADGMTFREACQILQDEYDAASYLWGSWGNYDKRMFTEQCEWQGVPYPFSDAHMNIKKAFGKYYGKRIGMAGAMKMLNLQLEGTHHRGDDDAWNIAAILAHMLDDHGRDLLLPYWMTA